MARPTKKQVADRKMAEVETEMRSKLPDVMSKGLKRMIKMVEDENTADNTVLGAIRLATAMLADLEKKEQGLDGEMPADEEREVANGGTVTLISAFQQD